MTLQQTITTTDYEYKNSFIELYINRTSVIDAFIHEHPYRKQSIHKNILVNEVVFMKTNIPVREN